MFDLLIKNATVVDGLGGPPVREAVAVSEGKVVARGSDAEGSATRVTDGDGLMLAPGFIDIHTHYDAQVLWDPACSPSLLHGVTTIIAGNCGLTLAPVMPGNEDFLTRLLAKVEAIPVAALQAGVPFNWKTFADFLDVVEGSTALNVGFLVGHSALRRQVMGEAASESRATAGQIEQMQTLLAEAIQAGGLGFSTSTAKSQVDGDGRPTPPKLADREEFLALAQTAGAYPGTSLEFIPLTAMDGFNEDDSSLLSAMSTSAGRPINWNALSVTPGASDLHTRQLEVSDRAETRRRMGGAAHGATQRQVADGFRADERGVEARSRLRRTVPSPSVRAPRKAGRSDGSQGDPLTCRRREQRLCPNHRRVHHRLGGQRHRIGRRARPCRPHRLPALGRTRD